MNKEQILSNILKNREVSPQIHADDNLLQVRESDILQIMEEYANQQTERLKALIEKEYKNKIMALSYDKKETENFWQQFKKENNL